MTEEELNAIKDRHSTAVSIWMDRKHEGSTVALTEALLYYIPAEDFLDAVGRIETEQKEEEKYDTGSK